MDLSVQQPVITTNSPLRHGRKAAIMRKFMKEEIQKTIMLASESQTVNLPDLTSCFSANDAANQFSDSNVSDDVIIIEEQSTVDVLVIKDTETASSEEEAQRDVPVVKVTILDKTPNDTDKSALKRYKCPSCKFVTSEKLLLKTHLLLHTIEKHEITSDPSVHGCNHKIMPCFLCSLPKNHAELNLKKMLAPNKDLECPVCFRTFLKKNGLNKHLQAHIDQHKKCSAQLGKREKKFNQKNQKIIQMASNGRKFPFECSKCRFPFAEEYDKRAHEELCQRRQYKHLWNFTDATVKANELKRANTNNAKEVKTSVELKTPAGMSMNMVQKIEIKLADRMDARKVQTIDARKSTAVADVRNVQEIGVRKTLAASLMNKSKPAAIDIRIPHGMQVRNAQGMDFRTVQVLDVIKTKALPLKMPERVQVRKIPNMETVEAKKAKIIEVNLVEAEAPWRPWA